MEQQEQQTAMYPLCTLIKSDGTRCGSPALTGANFCFHHIGGRIPSQTRPSAETTGPYTPLDFVYPDSHAAIQHNLFLLVQALNERKIDNRTANTFNRLFRACELNLRNAGAAKASIKLDETPQEQRSAASDQPHFELSSRPKSASAQRPAVSSSQSSEIDNEYHEVKGPLTDDDETMLADLFPDAIARYKAAYAARAQAAIDAGLEPPVYEPWDLSKFESKPVQSTHESPHQPTSARTTLRPEPCALRPELTGS